MNRTNAKQTENLQEVVTTTLLDRLDAVQAALADMPDAAINTTSDMADAFLGADPVLASLSKQKADAKSNYNKLVHAFGFDDAMVESAQMQRAAIETAYADRLAALRRKRSTEGRSVKLTSQETEEKLQGITRKAVEQDRQRHLQREEERLLHIARELRQKKNRNDALWLWAAMLLGLFNHTDYQHRPALRLA